jgi:hypothetical protein
VQRLEHVRLLRQQLGIEPLGLVQPALLVQLDRLLKGLLEHITRTYANGVVEHEPGAVSSQEELPPSGSDLPKQGFHLPAGRRQNLA